MKKQSFLIMAGALMALASCKNENTDTASNQAQIDSTVNARVEEMRMQMMMQNDSMINVLAQQRADSIIAAMKGGNTVTTHTTRTTTVNTAGSYTGKSTGGTKTTTVESGGLQSQSDQNRINDKNSVQGGGLQSQSDQNKDKNNNFETSG